MSEAAAQILKACTDEYKVASNRAYCNNFVSAVARDVGKTVNGSADVMISWLDHGGAKTLPNGFAARQSAMAGKLVLAGLSGADHTPPRVHGHIVVVVSGPMDRTWPMCYAGGSVDGRSNGTRSVGQVWNKVDRENVGYWEL